MRFPHSARSPRPGRGSVPAAFRGRTVPRRPGAGTAVRLPRDRAIERAVRTRSGHRGRRRSIIVL
ncbi:MAG TPA: hypothetical protein VH912_10150, partial [Streptosporangiaceae bacterium]